MSQAMVPDMWILLTQASKLPLYAHWQGLLQGVGVDLRLQESVNLQTHSGGEVSAVLEGVRCTFELTRSAPTPEQLASLPQGAATPDCVLSFHFDSNHAADAMAALFAAGALAQLTDGQLAPNTTPIQWIAGNLALARVSSLVQDIRIATTPEAAFQSRRLGSTVNVTMVKADFLRCPRCRDTFEIHDRQVWDGEKHLRCGQRISPIATPQTGPKKRVTTASSAPRATPTRKWWWPFGGKR